MATDSPHAYVKFYLDAQPDAAESREAGRQVYRDVEMVEIRFVGDKECSVVAEAHEKFLLNRGNPDLGPYISYAQRYPEHYAAFKRDAAEAEVGTPLDHLPFLTKSQVAEFKAQSIRTVEALANMSDRIVAKAYGWRALREQAQAWLTEADKMALVTKANAERDALAERLAKLEALLEQRTAPAAAAVAGDEFDAMSDDDLRAWLEDQGAKPRANASRERMLDAARLLRADAA